MVMHMRNCCGQLGSQECIDSIDALTHEGTRKKIEFIEGYVKSWFHKILLNSYTSFDGVIFIDCMSNCGIYSLDKKSIVEGSSYRVLDSFSRQNEGKLSNKKFTVVVNDLDDNKVICQECLWEKIFFGKNKNLSFRSSRMDVNEFLSTKGLSILEEAVKSNYHILLLYDPYKVEIDWKVLEHFISSRRVDLIITHFWQNDIKRSLSNKISKEKQQIIEKAYDFRFDDLLRIYNTLSPYERNEFLRNRFKEQIEKSNHGMKEVYVGYGPIFNQNKVAVYDIVGISHSMSGFTLFKDELYKKYKPMKEEIEEIVEGGQQLTLDDQLFTPVETQPKDNYVMARKSGLSELEYFYSPKHFSEIIADNFSGKVIKKELYIKYLEGHPFIPLNEKNAIKSILRKQHGMKIIKEYGKEAYYSFAEEKRNE